MAKGETMTKEKDLEFYEAALHATDPGIKKFMDEEIAAAPKAPSELDERLAENTASSPADSGGDIDAEWEDVNDSGAESVFGHNPTPDQSDAEANAHAMGLNYEDNEPLDPNHKIEKRDKDRFELDPRSRSKDGI